MEKEASESRSDKLNNELETVFKRIYLSGETNPDLIEQVKTKTFELEEEFKHQQINELFERHERGEI